MTFIPSRSELPADPRHAEINVVRIIIAELLAVVDREPPREKRSPGRRAMPVRVMVREDDALLRQCGNVVRKE